MQTGNERFPVGDMQMTYLIGRLEGMEMGGDPIRAYSELRCRDYDHGKFKKAVDMLIESNEMLRCAVYQDGTQEITDCGIEDIKLNKLNITENEAKEYIEKKRSEIFSVLFDLEKPPLIYFEVSLFSDDTAIIHMYHDGIIADGWSHEMLIRELDEFYCGDRTVPLELSYSYKDYVDSINRRKNTEKYSECRQFWLEQIKSFPEAPDLRSRNVPEKMTETSRQITREFSKEEYESLKKNAFSRHLSAFAVFLTAYGKAISKYSSENPFLLNIPMAARDPKIPDMTYTIGEYSDFLIFDWTEKTDESFMDRAYEVQDRLFELIENRIFTGIEVVQELQKMREGALIAPIVLTSTLDIPYKSSKKLEKIYSKTHTSQVWLDSILMYTQDSVLLTMDYIEEKIGTVTINKIADIFIGLIKQFAADPESWNDIYDIPLDEDERAVSEQPFSEVTITDNFGALMKESFRKCRDRAAVISSKKTLTYRELQNYAGALRDEIISRCGSDKHKRVGILLEKGWKQPAVEAACLITNMTFVPVEKDNSDKVLLKMFDNLEISCIVTEHSLVRKWQDMTSVPVIDASEISCEREYGDDIFAVDSRDPECYCIHSSGTTGTPKAIMLNEEGLVNCVLQTKAEFDINENDRCIAVTNLCHDMSVYDSAGILSAGGTVVIPEGSEEEKDPSVWLRLIKEHRVNIWNGSPSVMEMLMTEGEALEAVKGQFKAVILGGEVFPTNLAGRIRDILSPEYIYNVGGPAETTIWSIWHRVTDDDINSTMIPYGHPLKGVRYRVFDSFLRNCPSGKAGEMYVSGISLAVGYHNMQELTEEKFVMIDGIRWYKTGDLGWYMPDGEIAFGGRKDLQVEINGKRVELEGIASILMDHGAIERCVVVTTEKSGLLTAFYSAEKDIPEYELEVYANENLPRYMRPARYVRLEEFPITPSGKTNIKKLREYECEVSSSVIAVTEDEKKLERICCELINDDYDISRSLYQNGGNSISVIKLVNRIRTVFGARISAADILKAPYFLEWIRLIRNSENVGKQESSKKETQDSYPLSPEQQDMWIYDDLHRNTRYVISARLSINETMDADKLNRSIRSVLSDEPILRAVFRIDKNKMLRQLIQNDIPEDCLSTFRIAGKGMDDFIMTSLADMPMELDKGPLYRFMLFSYPDGHSVFMITLHHIISDEQSFGILYKHILDRYYGKTSGDDRSNDYFSYILEGAENAEGYDPEWEELKNAEPADDIYMPEKLTVDRSCLEKDHEFDEAVFNKLQRLCVSENVSLFSGLLVLFTRLINEFTEQKNIWISVPASDRASGAYENTIGMFVKKLIIKMPSDTEDMRSSLHTAQEAWLKASSQTSAAFRTFTRRNNIVQKLNEIYGDMVLNLIDSGDDTGYGAFDYIRNKAESNATKLQLMIDINENARVYRFYYDKDYFSDAEMTFITKKWQDILDDISKMEV